MAAIVISKQWDGSHSNTRAVVVTFALEKSGDISILIDAPFHNDPAPSVPVGKYLDLVNYECIQVLIGIGQFPTVGEDEQGGKGVDYSNVQYLEVCVGPHGHYSARMFSGEGKFDLCDNELQFPTPKVMINTNEDCWNSEVRIPLSYVPEPEYLHPQNALKWMINAFASHGGSGTDVCREVLALSPLTGSEVNCHQLACFVPIILRADVSNSSGTGAVTTPMKTVFRRGSGVVQSAVNLNLVDADSLSEGEGSDDEDDGERGGGGGNRARGSTEGDGEDSENMRMYRILSGIAEEQDHDIRASNAQTLRASTGGDGQGQSQRQRDSASGERGVRLPSKDWYTINRENDPNAPPTLGSFTAQYRGKTRLEPKFQRYMNDDEFPLLYALIWKRKGWSHKQRVLILTSKPRLFYLDEKGKYKGTIPWTSAEQIKASKISSTQFDIAQGTSDRVYHFTDKETGADRWVELINSVVNVWHTNIEYEKSRPRNSFSGSGVGGGVGIEGGVLTGSGAPATPIAADNRLRSGSSSGNGNGTTAMSSTTPQNSLSPPNSQNSGSAVMPLTVTELLEKHRRGPREGAEQLAFLSGIPAKHEAMFLKFIHPDEFVVMQGYVHKQQGFLQKKRVLILTSKPRLLYLKRDGTFVGTIAWSMTTPITATKTGKETFDLTESVGKEVYHFSDRRGGADRWVDIIKEICDGWAAYMKWQVGKVKGPVTKPNHTRT